MVKVSKPCCKHTANNHASLVLQYFEYTSRKEIRFNSVTELCAEVLEGQTSIGMRHCPSDVELRPPSIIWEFRQVGGSHTSGSSV